MLDNIGRAWNSGVPVLPPIKNLWVETVFAVFTVFPVVVTSFPQTEELSLGLKACSEFPIVPELGGIDMVTAHFSGYMDFSQTWQNQLPMISRKKAYRAGVLSPQGSHFSSFYTFKLLLYSLVDSDTFPPGSLEYHQSGSTLSNRGWCFTINSP